jgi:hypothetical protein
LDGIAQMQLAYQRNAGFRQKGPEAADSAVV